MASIVILTGPPGAGKSTVAARFAREQEKAVHLHADDFWHYIVAGGIPPYDPRSDQQNQVVLRVVADAAFDYAAGGYLTVLDGIVGPWMLDHFRRGAEAHPSVDLHYIVLRPDRAVTLARAAARTGPDALTEEEPILHMWGEFSELDHFEAHVIDTSQEDEAQTVARVADAVDGGQMRIPL